MSTPDYEAPAAEDDLNDDKKKAKKLRSALVKTEGGIGGEAVLEGQAKKRDTLFGN